MNSAQLRYSPKLLWQNAKKIKRLLYWAHIPSEEEYVINLLSRGTALSMKGGNLQAVSIPAVAEMGDKSIIASGSVSTEIRYDSETGDVEISTYGGRGGLQSRIAIPDVVLLRALEMRGLIEAKPRR